MTKPISLDNDLSSSSVSSSPSRRLTRRASRKKHDTLSSLKAGVGSGAASSIVCAPLDLVRTRMQVMGDLQSAQRIKLPTPTSPPITTLLHNHKTSTTSIPLTPKLKTPTPNNSKQLNVYHTLKHIVTNDGIRGCFRGLGMTLLTVPTFWGLYFPLYETFKSDIFERYALRQHLQQENDTITKTTSSLLFQNDSNASIDDHHAISPRVPAAVHMTSAILAGAVADFFCNPMFVVRTRMQTEALHDVGKGNRTTGILKTVKGLYVEGGGGLGTFWRGYAASLLGLSHVAIQFPLYEWLKAEARHRSPSNEESPLEILAASAISKMVATTLTYPHEVIRSRMMDYRGDGTTLGQNNGLLCTFRRVTRNEGLLGLYTGMHVSLLRVVPNCCVTFMTYEMILRWSKRQQDDF